MGKSRGAILLYSFFNFFGGKGRGEISFKMNSFRVWGAPTSERRKGWGCEPYPPAENKKRLKN